MENRLIPLLGVVALGAGALTLAQDDPVNPAPEVEEAIELLEPEFIDGEVLELAVVEERTADVTAAPAGGHLAALDPLFEALGSALTDWQRAR